MMTTTDHYETLGVSPGATDEEIKRAWRKVARTTHPDHGGNTDAFQAAHEAFTCLSDPLARAAYDARRRAENGHATGGSSSTGASGGTRSGSTRDAYSSRDTYSASSWREAALAYGAYAADVATLLIGIKNLERTRDRLAAQMHAAPVAERATLAAQHADVLTALASSYRRLGDLAGLIGMPADDILAGPRPSRHDTGATPPVDPQFDGAPKFQFADGTVVECRQRNRHGAWVPSDAQRRQYDMGPKTVYKRLRVDDPLLRVAPPMVSSSPPWQKALAFVVSGPRWIKRGWSWYLAAVLAVLGLGAGFVDAVVNDTALTWTKFPLVYALVGAWWPTSALVRWVWYRRSRTTAYVAAGISVVIALAFPALVATSIGMAVAVAVALIVVVVMAVLAALHS